MLAVARSTGGGQDDRSLRVYLDYNATAPLRPEVKSALEPFFASGQPLNPSSVHRFGREAKEVLERARSVVLDAFSRTKRSEVIFTSGGTEAANLALFGVMADQPSAKRFITTTVEHPCVLEAAERLESSGAEVVRIGVDEDGRLDLDALRRELAAKPTTLVSCMAVNNETGVILPTEEVIAQAHTHGALVHVDAVQSAGRLPLPTEADLVSISGHKLGGVVGSGALICRESIVLHPMVLGGPQERSRRAGTESALLALSLAVALEASMSTREQEQARALELQQQLETAIDRIDGARILGAKTERVPQTTLVLFDGVEGEAVLQALDLEDVAASSGSACSSGSLEPSSVLLAMGVPEDKALGSVRFSSGWGTQRPDIDRVIELLPRLVARARSAAM